MKGKLTAKEAEHAGPAVHGDGVGLWLRVVTQERRSWVLRYLRHGKAREMGLDAFPDVSLADTRDKRQAARKLLTAGVDPIEVREADRQAEAAKQAYTFTFSQGVKAYITSRETGWRNAKSAPQWRSSLAIYAEPVIGQMACSAIHTDDVLKVLKPIWAEKPETAARVRRRIEAVLSYARSHGWRSGKHPGGMARPPGAHAAASQQVRTCRSSCRARLARRAGLHSRVAHAISFSKPAAQVLRPRFGEQHAAREVVALE